MFLQLYACNKYQYNSLVPYYSFYAYNSQNITLHNNDHTFKDLLTCEISERAKLQVHLL